MKKNPEDTRDDELFAGSGDYFSLSPLVVDWGLQNYYVSGGNGYFKNSHSPSTERFDFIDQF